MHRPSTRPPVYICAPYAPGERSTEENVERACALARFAAMTGFAPIVVHPGIAPIFGADTADLRAIGLDVDVALVQLVATHPHGQLWALMPDGGAPSAGMRLEIEAWLSAPTSGPLIAGHWSWWLQRTGAVGPLEGPGRPDASPSTPTTMDLLEARTERNEAIKRAEAAEAELVRQQALQAEVEMERDTMRGRAELAEHLVTVLQGRLDEGPINEGGVSQEVREMTKTLEQTAVAVQAAALRTLQVERDELRARIEDMSQRAESLQSRCDELESETLALCGRWDAAESLLKEADARAEAAEAERDALRAAVAQLEAAAQTPTSPEGGR